MDDVYILSQGVSRCHFGQTLEVLCPPDTRQRPLSPEARRVAYLGACPAFSPPCCLHLSRGKLPKRVCRKSQTIFSPLWGMNPFFVGRPKVSLTMTCHTYRSRHILTMSWMDMSPITADLLLDSPLLAVGHQQTCIIIRLDYEDVRWAPMYPILYIHPLKIYSMLCVATKPCLLGVSAMTPILSYILAANVGPLIQHDRVTSPNRLYKMYRQGMRYITSTQERPLGPLCQHPKAVWGYAGGPHMFSFRILGAFGRFFERKAVLWLCHGFFCRLTCF